jgi:hypothetical protein
MTSYKKLRDIHGVLYLRSITLVMLLCDPVCQGRQVPQMPADTPNVRVKSRISAHD